ncbi:DEAD/DEAH box helicase [Cohnella yongneupensis]|uniref:DEAD/DEAH box helicase n=1 Tax=Cohnella yongneupensis TaxID=425006 RepID=A0ABW0QVR9_9BACL
MSFEQLGLKIELAERLAAAGIAEPTDVQKAAIPELVSGKDGVIVSPTGTGKTLAYLLPLLNKIDGSRREVQAIVLAPTQELAMQIMREAQTYGEPLGIRAVALIGGAALSRQLERMKTKPALVVGTPGRVREVSQTKKLSLHAVSFVVVDETDRVFALGGKSDVEHMMRHCARERQTVFVSATRSDAMKEAERKWQKEPWVADETASGNDNGLSPTLKHWYFLSDRRDKIDMIRKIVRHMKPTSALLFVNDTEKIGELLSKLRYEGFSVDALYGDTPGRERGEVMQRFRKGRTSLLIATDVAARGLDIPGLPIVIQLEPALDADHYVHRAGRTARMGREGTSITLITPQERFIIDKLEKQLNIEVAPKMLSEGRIVAPEEAGVRKSREFERKLSEGDRDRKDLRPARPQGGAETSPGAKPGQASLGGKPLFGAKPAARFASVPQAGNSAKPGNVTKSGTVSKPGTPPQAAKSAAAKPKPKADRERDRKNKGAPKWLKEKREGNTNNK